MLNVADTPSSRDIDRQFVVVFAVIVVVLCLFWGGCLAGVFFGFGFVCLVLVFGCHRRFNVGCLAVLLVDCTQLIIAETVDRLVGLVVKASASRAEHPGFESRLHRDFFGVESHKWLKNWHSSGYPARRLAL